MKIVVMGGSFNPPTIAHLISLQTAMDSIGAEKGIFVPSSHAYVKRKMKKTGHPEEVFSEELRLAMLKAMAEDDTRISVNDLEYHRTEKGYTYETMEALQNIYPNDTLYFLAGGDKISIFPRWHRIREFLERFHIIVMKRDDEDATQEIEKYSLLQQHKDMFHVTETPNTLNGISSSAVRESLRNGENGAEKMLHPRVSALLQQNSKKEGAFS
ncbi:MAG: nicotinate (nicotinamide) nucleotide adenylyltransferase [Clostridia bacterium]|nr:nicotinate (nicotinamide) nucleotide adenylyltransferase [Clostridia bacterium]